MSTYIYSQDPNTKIWTCRETYPAIVKFSGNGKTKDEALKSLLKNKGSAHEILHTR